MDGSSVALTESSENSMLPAENVLNRQAGKVWETGTSTAAETLVMDLGSVQNATYFGFVHPDWTGYTSVEIEWNSTDSWGAPAGSSTITDANSTNVTIALIVANYRYFRFKFTKPSAATQSRVGWIFLGSAGFIVDSPDDGGFTESLNDNSSTHRTPDSSFSDQRAQYKTLQVEYSGIAEYNKTFLETHFAAVGTHTPFVFQPEQGVTGADSYYFVKFEDAPTFKNAGCSGGGLIWDTSIKLIEEPNP